MTMAAKAFGKRLDNFMTSPEAKEYMAELSSALESSDLLIKIPGNRYIPNRGTWAHPKLAVFFARWLANAIQEYRTYFLKEEPSR